MEKALVFTDLPNEIPDLWDKVYLAGVRGKDRYPEILNRWADLPPVKRGVIHRPIFYPDFNAYDNISKFLELLQDFGESNWQNGNPFIVDIFEAASGSMFTLDHLNIYRTRIRESFNMHGTKALLRVNGNTWNRWYTDNTIVTTRLLDTFDILLCQPSGTKPYALPGVPVLHWWEYAWDKFKYDSTGEWLTDPVTPPVDPPPVEPPVEPPPVYLPTAYDIIINGTVIGEIRAKK